MLTDITLGQYYPGNSCIHRLDPRTKILAVLFYMVMVFLAASPLSYGILIGFIVLGAALAKLPAGLLLRSIKPLWIIILLTMVIHFVTDPGCGSGNSSPSPRKESCWGSRCPCAWCCCSWYHLS